MFSEIIDLIKLWIVVKAITNPVMWVVCLVVFTALLFVSAIFIRFKNGWISLACFIILETLGIILIISLASTQVYTDDLHLDKGAVISCIDVTSDGVRLKKRFRTVTTPLLGLKLPESESKYFDSAKDYIQRARVSGKVYVYYSSVYRGVVLCDATFNSINEGLLIEGLAAADVGAPQQYIRLQQEAVKDKRGMWEIAAYKPQDLSILQYSVYWLLVINSVCIATVITTWIRIMTTELQSKAVSQPDR